MIALSPAFLHQLEQRSFVTRRRRRGSAPGERRSVRRGAGTEFADYRDYTQGDDLRRIDWNLYARLERPFVKLFEEEEDLTVHILIDASRSMDWGAAEAHKWNYARRLAAALGYIALTSGDRLVVYTFDAESGKHWGPHRGRAYAHRLFSWLDRLEANGPTALSLPLRHYAFSVKHPGLLLLLSDLFAPEGVEEGLSTLLASGYEVILLHLLSPDELDPPLGGDLRLIDIETGHAQDVTVDGSMRNLYRQRIRSWQRAIEGWCASRQIAYLSVSTALPIEQLILRLMRKRGLIR